jgi:hypothetical protein
LVSKQFFLVSDPVCLSSSSAQFFPIILFFSATLLSGMTGISLHRAMASDFSVAWQGLKTVFKIGRFSSMV